jgi:predicted lipoprotein
MHLLRLPALFAGLFLSSAALAADPAAIALDYADTFAIPRFQKVAQAAHAQQDAWSRFCTGRGAGTAEPLRDAYNALADAWAQVEFVRIGPAAIALRAERFNWWLDRTDATGKALNAMLASDPATLTVETLATGSVAGQGLPVIERLIYPQEEAAKLKGDAGAQRCAVGLAVAREQSRIADDIVADWTAPDGARAALAANTRWKVAFADGKEAASVMMTDLVAGLETLKDLKVAMLFHDVTNGKAPRLAEAARSGRTTKDIALNLQAIREGLSPFMAGASVNARTQLDVAFDDARRRLDEFDRAAPADRQAAITRALAVFVTLSQTAMTVTPQATGLTLGFNMLDGD